MSIIQRLAHAWNAFRNESKERFTSSYDGGAHYSRRPDRMRYRFTSEKSIVGAIYNRLSVDVASIALRHVRLDENDRWAEDMPSGLNECLKVKANTDQKATHFRQDIARTLFDKGCAAIVPIDTSINPALSGSFDIQTMRVGEVVGWMPTKVIVEVYNEEKGYREQIDLDKSFVAIVENPFYEVMNEPNSMLQRLIRKLNLLDVVDEQSASGKLDIIMQLPYAVKSETRRNQANQRRQDIEFQLKGSQYGIAWVDATEKITQLNRPAENNLLKQVEYLTETVYGQLGITPEILNGTADEKTMINYLNRTIEPIVKAIAEAMSCSFLTKTARTQKQTVTYFRDPFKLVPLSEIAEIVDKFTRNEVMTANEFRPIIGLKPSKDPKADELRNANMPEAKTAPSEPIPQTIPELGGDSQNGSLRRR